MRFLQGVLNVATAAAKTGARVLLISTALVTPKNRWSPFRILLNTVIRYNRANEKVSNNILMLPCDCTFRRAPSFLTATLAAAKLSVGSVATLKKLSMHRLCNCSLLGRLR